MKQVVIFLVFLGLSASANAESYISTGVGVAAMRWQAVPGYSSFPRNGPGYFARMIRSEFTFGWRFRNWLAAEATTSFGGTMHHSTVFSLSTLSPTPPGEPNLNSFRISEGTHTHRTSAVTAGPVFSYLLSRDFALVARPQLALFTDETRSVTNVYVGQRSSTSKPPLAGTSITTMDDHAIRPQLGGGVTWTPPSFPRCTLSVTCAHASTARVKLTTVLAGASLRL